MPRLRSAAAAAAYRSAAAAAAAASAAASRRRSVAVAAGRAGSFDPRGRAGAWGGRFGTSSNVERMD